MILLTDTDNGTKVLFGTDIHVFDFLVKQERIVEFAEEKRKKINNVFWTTGKYVCERAPYMIERVSVICPGGNIESILESIYSSKLEAAVEAAL